MSDSESSSSDSGSLYSTSKMDNKCRICLTESGEQDVCMPWPSPFKGMGPTIACDIYKLTKIIIFKHNRNRLICNDCCATLKHVCQFLNTIRLSDLILKNSYRKRFLKKSIQNSPENENNHIMVVLSPDEDNVQEAEIMENDSSQDGDGEDDESDEFDDDLIKAYSEITKHDNRHLDSDINTSRQPELDMCTQEKQAEQNKERQREQKDNEDKPEQSTKEIDDNLNKQSDLNNMCSEKQNKLEQNMCIPEEQPDQNMCISEPQVEHNLCIPEPQPEQQMCIRERQAEQNMCTQKQHTGENMCTQLQQAEQIMCIPEQQQQPNMCIQEPQIERKTSTQVKQLQQNVSTQEQQPEKVCTEEQIQIKQYNEVPPQDYDKNTKEWPKPIQLDKSVSNIIFDSTIEVKQEVLSEDEFDMPLEESDHLVAVKSEPSDYLEGNIQIVSCNGSVPFSSPEKISDREDFMREVGLKRVIKMEPMSTETSYLDEEFLDSSIKEEPWSEEEETDLSLDCQLCAKELSCLSGLRAHVIAQHSYKSVGVKKVESKQTKPGKFTCLICGKAFSTKTDQMVHSIGHAACVCFGCGRGFGSFGELAQHRLTACTQHPDHTTRQQYPRLIDISNCTKKRGGNDDHIEKNKEIEKNIKNKDEKEKRTKKVHTEVEPKIKIENEVTPQNDDEKQENIKNGDEKQGNTKNYVEIEINITKDDNTERKEREDETDIIKTEEKEEDNIVKADLKLIEDKKYDVHVEIVQEPADDQTQRKKRNRKRKSGVKSKPDGEAKHPKTEPPCPETCFFKCTQNFTTEESQAIRSQFSTLTGQAKWEFFLEHTVRKNTKEKSKNQDCIRRRHRFQFYFNKNNTRVRVCKRFFCDVLKIGCDTVSNVYSKFDNGRVTFNELNSKILENPSFRLSCKNITQVEKHILTIFSLNKQSSMESLNVDEMYAMYVNTIDKPVGKDIYRRIYDILLNSAKEQFKIDKPKRRRRKTQFLQVLKTEIKQESDKTDGVNKDSDSIKVEINDSEVSVKVEKESSDEEGEYLDENIMEFIS